MKTQMTIIIVLLTIVLDLFYTIWFSKEFEPSRGANIEASNNIIENGNHSMMFILAINMSILGGLLLWWNIEFGLILLIVAVILMQLAR